jgi:hypothetical protein
MVLKSAWSRQRDGWQRKQRKGNEALHDDRGMREERRREGIE